MCHCGDRAGWGLALPGLLGVPRTQGMGYPHHGVPGELSAQGTGHPHHGMPRVLGTQGARCPGNEAPREWGTHTTGCQGSSVPREQGTHTTGCLENRVPRERSTRAGRGECSTHSPGAQWVLGKCSTRRVCPVGHLAVPDSRMPRHAGREGVPVGQGQVPGAGLTWRAGS